MKTTKLLLRFTIFLLFSAIILGRIQIGTYGIFHFLLVFLLILIFLFPDNIVLSKFFQLDSISIYILFFLLVVTLSYLINYSNSEHVAKTYSSNTGESPKFLYGKIAVIGLVNVIAAFLAYNLGKIFSYKTKNLFVLYDSLFFLFAINAIVNVISWLITTHGVIGRYNFDYPFTGSPGLSIQFSSIGFLIGMPMLERMFSPLKKNILYVMMFFLLISILITVTRLSQISFVIMFFWYALKNLKLTAKAIFGIVFFIIAIAIVLILFSSSFSAYSNVSDSDDMLIRGLMLNSSYEIFLNYPIFGIGYGMFSGYNNTPVYITGSQVYLGSPHNGIASIACEQGLVGLLIILFLSFHILNKMNNKIKKLTNLLVIKYTRAIYILQFIFIGSIFLSNSILFGPPTEAPYLYFSFISWLMIGSVIGQPKVV